MSDFFEMLAAEILFSYPGAYIRWRWLGKKESFKAYCNKNSTYDFLLSFAIYAGIAALIYGLLDI